MAVNFFNEDHPFSLKKKREVKALLKRVVESFGLMIGEVNIIFCSDEYLLKMNRKHLSHDYYTDIITFNMNEDNIVSGDLFISADRTRENASVTGVSVDIETKRVIIHGVLHLCGLNDKSAKEKKLMRGSEDYWLEML